MNKCFLFANSKIKSVFILVMSFLLPSLVLLAAYSKMGLYPYGDKSILIMDMSGNFVDYFAQLRHVIQGESSIFYSWSKALGGNYIGIFAFCVSSPLSLITLIFPESMLTTAILIVNVIKIGLAGLAFCLYLKFVFKKNDISLVIFSLFYGLIAYSIAFSMCIMWLDGVIWLPIILIGIEKLLAKNIFKLLVISLLFLFISTYYIAYMVGIFSLIYFIYRYLTEYNSGLKNFIIKSIKFIISAAISAGLAAWLLFPVYYSLLQGKMDTFKYTFTFAYNFTLIDLITKFFIGSYDSITSSGLPGVFCGTIIFVLIPGYFFIKSISIKEKLVSLSIIIIMVISFYFDSIDLAWHAFKYPNWFPYRYSFVFSFFLLYLSYKAFTKIKEIPLCSYLTASSLIGIIILFTFKIKYPFLKSSDIYITFFFFIIYVVLLSILTFERNIIKNHQKIYLTLVVASLLFIALLEMSINTNQYVKSLDKEFGYIQNSSYTNFNKNMKPLVDKAKSNENTFFRMEKTFERSKNDSISLNYNGITHYSASYDRNINSFLKNLGFSQDYFWCSYFGSTIMTDSLLGVKYIVSENPLSNYYQPIDSRENMTMYKNPYALSLAFMSDDRILDVHFKDKEYLQNQNKIFRGLTNSDDDYLKEIEVDTKSENLTIESAEDYVVYTKIPGKDGYVSYKFTSPDNYPIYASFPKDFREPCELFINGKSKGYVFAAGESNNTIYVGTFNKGETVEIKLVLKYTTLKIEKKFICYLDMPIFEEAIESLKQNQFNVTYYDSTNVKGTVNVTDKNILFTSIPYDKGWSIKVDGVDYPIEKFANALIYITLPQGNHTIEMKYIPQGLTSGIIVSISTFSLVIAYMFVKKYLKLTKKN